MSETIRVLVADDHPVVREGLCGLIASKPGLEVVGEAEDGEEAILQARTRQPDVVVIDLMMPRKNGLEALKEIKQENPHMRILILTSFAEDEKLFQALDAGAQGCLLKDSSPQELIRAIRDVYQGELALHPAIARKLIDKRSQTKESSPDKNPLTEREIEVLKLVARGLSNRDIAKMLVVSEQTVRSHVTNILSKLHLTNRTQAVLYALRNGIARLDEGDKRV